MSEQDRIEYERQLVQDNDSITKNKTFRIAGRITKHAL